LRKEEREKTQRKEKREKRKKQREKYILKESTNQYKPPHQYTPITNFTTPQKVRQKGEKNVK
jgi:hypothetical protein